ncbi:TPA: XRE family transcriptional regulator [candidate division CPR2 bacterium]|uniref:DNA-binding protein n=1 Tax=candidate division CPR2 bacterium GW2011_GWC1_41_48 TaxID=1618344 RepID=A0A0G0W9Z2_UNCC2|nr:MAG: DNA-binding protein [candidate division CPR2 bacterium GW2011_GWC2_39_35]KKR28524.1 MAG: DNA-binding protein [candidate division CPR2 bacterium GW2011_GWD1_39_7]KKS09785.1 MAG: DNA-binding protein [candidate division CPR2 bacterium GW2011_GWC1_41_48]HBG81581.1 XRE family transcriptional regulator [candidate division CPR2 bacterium]HCL99454.1 XRE family transcriptional regulator [candidate division CPR2 bacterium]
MWYIISNMTNDNNETIRKELGEKIKKAREKAGLTQSEVAAAADINVSYYAQIERGEVNPSFEKLHSITKVLKLKSFDILKKS